MRFVIVGGGIAGTTAAEEIRKHDHDADIVLVSEEQHPIYSRVLLPHYVKGKVPRERVFLKKGSWYAEQSTEWLPAVRVESLDPRNRHISLSDGREWPYDKLVLAPGGDVRLATEDLRGISYFRTLDDADHLLRLLSETKTGDPAAVWGGGFIACEYLNMFSHFGRPTTVVYRGPHLWSRVLDSESGLLIHTHMQSHGVRIIANAQDIQAIGSRELEGIRVQGETVPCRLLGVGMGIEGDFAWLRDAGIALNQGILANAYLETNIPDIYAAGDAAEAYDPITNRQYQIGNWMNAMTQGRIAARNMIRERTECRLVSSYATNALGMEIIFVGDTSRAHADRIIVRGSAAQGGVTQIFFRDHRVVGASMVARNQDRMPLTKLIQDQTPIVDELADRWCHADVKIG